MDSVSVNSTVGTPGSPTNNAFTIEAVSFTRTDTISGGSKVTTTGSGASLALTQNPYSWVIARVNQAYNPTNAAGLLAALSLDTTNLPKPASGYQYFLSAQGDPSASATDLVVNYAPVPEPAALTLLAPAAAGLMLRRRRRSA
jgi:hypothetical protein